MYSFEFTDIAVKQFRKLDSKLQSRVKKKLTFLEQQKNPIVFAKTLVNLEPATHRFRVGDLRLLCCLEKKKLVILVLKIGLRGQVYQS